MTKSPARKPRSPRPKKTELSSAEILELRWQVARETLAWLSEWLWKKGKR